jgi:hypothetical protein
MIIDEEEMARKDKSIAMILNAGGKGRSGRNGGSERKDN